MEKNLPETINCDKTVVKSSFEEHRESDSEEGATSNQPKHRRDWILQRFQVELSKKPHRAVKEGSELRANTLRRLVSEEGGETIAHLSLEAAELYRSGTPLESVISKLVLEAAFDDGSSGNLEEMVAVQVTIADGDGPLLFSKLYPTPKQIREREIVREFLYRNATASPQG